MKKQTLVVPPELNKRYEELALDAQETKNDELLNSYIAAALIRAMDRYQLKRGSDDSDYLLPEELQQKLEKRVEGVEQAKKTNERKKPSVADAKADPTSLHHLLKININTNTPGEVTKFNLQVKQLASVLKVMSDNEVNSRKLKAKVSDLVIDNGWSGLETVVARVFDKDNVETLATKINPEGDEADPDADVEPEKPVVPEQKTVAEEATKRGRFSFPGRGK